MPVPTYEMQTLLRAVRALCRSMSATATRPVPNDQGLDIKEATAIVGFVELDKLALLHDAFASEPVWSQEELYPELFADKDDAD